MGDPNGEGLPIRVDINPISEVPTKTPGYQGPPLNRRGDTEACGQRCSEEGLPLYGTIPQPDLPGPQERRVSKVGDQLEAPESVHTPSTLQNGESGDDERSAEGGQLDGLDRPKRCLPVSHNMGRSPEASEVSMAGQYIQVSVPPLRSEQCTTCLHQVIETCSCKALPSGNEIDNVFRQQAGDGMVQGGAGKTLIPDNNS